MSIRYWITQEELDELKARADALGKAHMGGTRDEQVDAAAKMCGLAWGYALGFASFRKLDAEISVVAKAPGTQVYHATSGTTQPLRDGLPQSRTPEQQAHYGPSHVSTEVVETLERGMADIRDMLPPA